MKFMDREIDEGLYMYAAVSAAVISSVYIFYRYIWKPQQQTPYPTPLPLSHEEIESLKELVKRNSMTPDYATKYYQH